MLDLAWFNLSYPKRATIGGRYFHLWNLWRRRSTDGHWWGFGIVQIGTRHLFYIGRSQGNADAEVWDVSILFFRLV